MAHRKLGRVADIELDPVEVQIVRRQERAAKEISGVTNCGLEPVFSRFLVSSSSGRDYEVEIRSVASRLNSCSCPDYRTNTLGTCKHIEGALLHLRRRLGRKFKKLANEAPAVSQIFLTYSEKTQVRVNRADEDGAVGELLDRYFDPDGVLIGDQERSLRALLADVDRLHDDDPFRVQVDEGVRGWLERAQDLGAIVRQKEWFLRQVEHGSRSTDVISTGLYDFQQDGMLHLAFGQRVMLADDMGLGKTVQAIAAASLLHQLRDIRTVLIVCPASLKHQWAREIKRFTSFPVTVIEGSAEARSELYRRPQFFNIMNYELVLRDLEKIQSMSPDLVILDEAQRIKNWRSKTADAVKQLSSLHAFVLTGTPLENRLDELYSIFQFIDPAILGPLWRFNDRYVEGTRRKSGSFKVLGYKNLGELRARIAPYTLRRTRSAVLNDLPERTDNTFFVELTGDQADAYEGFRMTVAKLSSIARRRPLTPKEHEVLMMSLTKMRMICDALALHEKDLSAKEIERSSPKLRELRLILADEVVGAGRKAIVFSQWTSMLDLIVPVLDDLGIGYVMLTGKVPSPKRGALIEKFFDDPECMVFLSSDAGGVGLNLQAANVVINIELPWNPAVLEQRIARAHRHGQARAVQVINLVTRGTIEERMLDTLAAKRSVFAGVFGGKDADADVMFEDGGATLIQQLAEVLKTEAGSVVLDLEPQEKAVAPSDSETKRPPFLDFSERLVALYPGRILLVERGPKLPEVKEGASVLVVVDRDPSSIRVRAEVLLGACFGDADATPQLLLMEQEGYAAFTAMSGGNAGQASGRLFRSPSLAGGEDGGEVEQRNRNLVRANEGFDQCDRKIQLASLMADHEYPEEVLRPIRTALALALTSHLVVENGGKVDHVLPAARIVHTRLVETKLISIADAGAVARIRELTEEPAEGEEVLAPPSRETSLEMIETLRNLVDQGRERCASRILNF